MKENEMSNQEAAAGPATTIPKGWYPEGDHRRWWTGVQWADDWEVSPDYNGHLRRIHGAESWAKYTQEESRRLDAVLNPVSVQPVYVAGGNDRYLRMASGHSMLLWFVISGFTAGLGLIPMIYFTFSPRHYWHV
jgi:hypothetical protein